MILICSMSEEIQLLADINTHVEIELTCSDGEHEIMAFDIVPEDQADYYNGFLGVCTPIAQAIIGRPAGTTVSYKAGDICKIKILSVSHSTRQAPADRAAQREETIRKAVAESEIKDRIAVATAVDNKWGDSDPDGLLETLEDQVAKNR